MSLFPIILDDPVWNSFNLDPNSWHHENTVPALKIISIPESTGTREDIGVTYFKISFLIRLIFIFIVFFPQGN